MLALPPSGAMVSQCLHCTMYMYYWKQLSLHSLALWKHCSMMLLVREAFMQFRYTDGMCILPLVSSIHTQYNVHICFLLNVVSCCSFLKACTKHICTCRCRIVRQWPLLSFHQFPSLAMTNEPSTWHTCTYCYRTPSTICHHLISTLRWMKP